MEIYYASTINHTVKKVEITKKTDKSVWLGGRHEKIEGSFWKYCDTFQEAKDWIIEYLSNSVESKQRQLDYSLSELKKAELMQPL